MEAIYPTDLTDEHWPAISRLIPPAKPGERPRSVNLRQVLNALFYLGTDRLCVADIAHGLPSERHRVLLLQTLSRARGVGTNSWFDVSAGACEARQAATAQCCDHRQSIGQNDGKKGDCCGYDAGKKGKGRKRHILVDTLGLIWGLVVHSGSVQDRDGAKLVLETVQGKLPRLELIWADGGYAGKLIEWVQQACGWTLEIVKRGDDVKGFQVLPKRWIVERPLGWDN